MRLTSPISFSDNAARLPMPKRLISSFFVVVIMVVVWYNAVNLASFSGNVGRKDAPGTGGHIQPAQQQKPESNLAKIANGGEEVPSQGAPESSLPSSFPKLPPPDNEEYMAFCMVGE